MKAWGSKGIPPGSYKLADPDEEKVAPLHSGKYAEIYATFDTMVGGERLPIRFTTRIEAVQAQNAIGKYLRARYGPVGKRIGGGIGWQIKQRDNVLHLIKYGGKGGTGKISGKTLEIPVVPEPDSVDDETAADAVAPEVKPAASVDIPESAAPPSPVGGVSDVAESGISTLDVGEPATPEVKKVIPPDLLNQMEGSGPKLSLYEEEFGKPKPKTSEKEELMKRIKGEG
jgi:hypothetical protein